MVVVDCLLVQVQFAGITLPVVSVSLCLCLLSCRLCMVTAKLMSLSFCKAKALSEPKHSSAEVASSSRESQWDGCSMPVDYCAITIDHGVIRPGSLPRFDLLWLLPYVDHWTVGLFLVLSERVYGFSFFFTLPPPFFYFALFSFSLTS